MPNSSDHVRELAHDTGFDTVGFAPLRAPRGAARFQAWLAAGRHAGMDWLAKQAADTLEPRNLLPEGRSLVMVGLAHARPAVELADGARVARYAAGRDYHNLLNRRLIRLGKALSRAGIVRRWRKFADAGPLLERSHAAEAGLGFESKAANLLHPRLGPWFFLGELLVDAELEHDGTPVPGSCGTCTACIDACPTQAITADGVVDARRCISYHTIESVEPIPHELRAHTGAWAFGCDVCSEVCPWGQRAPDATTRFGTHAAIDGAAVVDWLALKPAEFATRFEGSALRRAGADGLARNAAHALAHLAPSDERRAALLRALTRHAAPLVREAAAWALARRYGADAGVRDALERARASEPDVRAAALLRETLSGR